MRASQATRCRIKVRPHPQFKRVGDDITLDLPITIDEAVLGPKSRFHHNRPRAADDPKGTSSSVFRLRGKGA